MMELLNEFTKAELIFFCIGIIATVLFIIQTSLSFIGTDDIEFDTEEGFEILTIKNLVIFMMIFGWSGMVAIDSFKLQISSSIVFSFTISVLVIFILSGIVYFMSKMKHDGTIKMENCIGKIAQVYLNVSPQGMGKVTLSVQGAYREFDAISKNKVYIPSGANVKVTGFQDNILEVETINS
jgi:membrane protein implicated in regulation of membrane protease activity